MEPDAATSHATGENSLTFAGIRRGRRLGRGGSGVQIVARERRATTASTGTEGKNVRESIPNETSLQSLNAAVDLGGCRSSVS